MECSPMLPFGGRGCLKGACTRKFNNLGFERSSRVSLSLHCQSPRPSGVVVNLGTGGMTSDLHWKMGLRQRSLVMNELIESEVILKASSHPWCRNSLRVNCSALLSVRHEESALQSCLMQQLPKLKNQCEMIPSLSLRCKQQ
jgi:hypothetical protein